jgi:molybdopterin-containing oxidoreductase family membrane subunit
VNPSGAEGRADGDHRRARRPAAPERRVREHPAPGVESYEQVDREISARSSHAGLVLLLGIAIAFFLWGAGTWTYQIYWGLGNAGYNRR